VDVRKHGSGNIGATNVFRILGRKWGILVFVLDAGKGLAAVMVAKWLSKNFPIGLGDGLALHLQATTVAPVVGAILASIWCLIGHSFPVWLGLKGGKGVATTVGVMLGLLPLATVIVFFIWVIVYYTTRYVSLASILGAIALPVAVLAIPGDPDKWPLFTLALVAAFLIIWRHRANIERLLQGKEHRFEKKKD
jgi:glycerol-3-phosphate acyltransferase PlsY